MVNLFSFFFFWVEGGGGDLRSDLKDNKNIKKANVWMFGIETRQTYQNLIISPLSVTKMTTFTIYLLQMMTNNDSLIYQKFLILKFYHKYQETTHLALFVQSQE